MGKSSLCNYTHHEPVQRVCWTRDPLGRGHRGYLLCSIAADGKVLMWSLGAAGGGGLPAMGFLLPMPSAGKAQGANAAPQGEGMHAGGSALCFSKEDPTTFIVGLESGQLYKCSTVAKEARAAAAAAMRHATARGCSPFVLDAAAQYAPGCSPTCSRLQPYTIQAAAPRAPGCSLTRSRHAPPRR